MHDNFTVRITTQSLLEPLVAWVLRSLRRRMVVKRYHKIDGAARLQRLGAKTRLADALGGPLRRAVIAALLPRRSQ